MSQVDGFSWLTFELGETSPPACGIGAGWHRFFISHFPFSISNCIRVLSPSYDPPRLMDLC